MASIEAALKALGEVEGILRRRYQYEHPIFGHVAEVRENLEGLAAEAAAAASPPPERRRRSRGAAPAESNATSSEIKPSTSESSPTEGEGGESEANP